MIEERESGRIRRERELERGIEREKEDKRNIEKEKSTDKALKCVRVRV